MACGVTFRGQRCATCGEPVDDTGVHHLHCKGAHLISRHDSLVTTGVALWKSVRGRGGILTEQLGYFGPSGGQKRADIVIEDDTTIRDVCCCCPLAPSYLAAAQHAGGAADMRSAAKVSRHRASAASGGYSFEPWTFEAWGAWGQAVRSDFAALTREVHETGRAEGDFTAASRWSTHWRQRLPMHHAVGGQRARGDRSVPARSDRCR